MMDPRPRLRSWSIRLAYAVVLQTLLVLVLHYNPQNELAAVVFLTAHLWFIVTFGMTFYYSQQLITYKFRPKETQDL